MTDTTVTPARLWKRMSPEQRLRAGQALWGDEQAAGEQRQAAQLVAQHRKFRLKTVLALDAERKARHLATVPELPEALAVRVLVVYHLAEQRPMMGAFLDALGIAHDNGLIQDDTVTPDPTKLAEAAATLARAYPADDVSLYLHTLLWQDPASWGALLAVPEVSGRDGDA